MNSRKIERSRAIAAFHKRCQGNKGKPRVDNVLLRAGAPMYYYCQGCGVEMSLPEDHRCNVPTHCHECKILVANGWMPTKRKVRRKEAKA